MCKSSNKTLLTSLAAFALFTSTLSAATRALFDFNASDGLTLTNSVGGAYLGMLKPGAALTNVSRCDAGSCVRLNEPGCVTFGPALLNELPEGTVEVWVYVESLGPAGAPILSKGDNSLTDFVFSVGPEGTLSVHMGTARYFSTTRRVPLRTWTKVAVAWDGTQWSLYINDILEARTPATESPLYNANNLVQLGRHNHADGPYYFDGMIDDLEISTVAKSFCSDTNRIAEYRFEERSGNDVKDDGCSELHGTLQGGVTRVPFMGGSGIQFDGTGFVLLPANVLRNHPVTFEARIRVDSYNPNGTPIVSKGDATVLTEFYVGLFSPTDITAPNRLAAGHFGTPLVITGNAPIELGRVYDIAFTCDGQFWRLYVNGNLDAEMASPLLPVASDHVPTLGWHRNAASPLFHGLMDNVRFSHTLAPSLTIRPLIRIEYPSWASNYVLQSSSRLSPGCWRSVPELPTLRNNRWYVDIETTGMEIFQLRRP